MHDPAVQSLFRMVVDGGAKILEITSRAANGASPSDELSARFSGDLRELPRAPKVIEPLKASVELWAVRLPSSARLVVGEENIGDRYFFEFSLLAARAVFFGDIGSELDLRVFSLALKTSCGDMAIAVEDDPGCASDDLVSSVPLCGTQP